MLSLLSLLGSLATLQLTYAQSATTSSAAATASVSAFPTWDWTNSQKKMNGIALGNWLVLEKWMDEVWFDNSCGNSSAIDQWTWTEAAGDNAATELENHYNSYITDDDITTIANSGFNTIRIPIGYWAFGIDAGEPYVSANELAQVDRILESAYNHSLYVVIDLHALPGSQNGEQESGHVGYNNFYQSTYQNASDATVDALITYVQASPYKSLISAVALCNEPIYYTEDQYDTLVAYYERSYAKTSAAGIPAMIHPGHPQVNPLSLFQGFINNKDPSLLIMEIHPYPGRNENNLDQSSLLQEVCTNAQSYAGYGIPVSVTEWSLITNITDNATWEKQFYAAQTAAWAQSAGGMFWSYKAATYDNISSTAWNYLNSFEDLVAKGSVPLPSSGESVNDYISGLTNPCSASATATETWSSIVPSQQPSVTAAITSS